VRPCKIHPVRSPTLRLFCKPPEPEVSIFLSLTPVPETHVRPSYFVHGKLLRFSNSLGVFASLLVVRAGLGEPILFERLA
jgi:hypothetical protein